MLTFATKKLSTGANGQKEDAASFFCPRSFDGAVMVTVSGSGSTLKFQASLAASACPAIGIGANVKWRLGRIQLQD